MVAAGQLLLASIPFLISLYTTRWKDQDEAKVYPRNPKNFNLPILKTFDFIIVGAGTAGCILANRLSKKYSVLLIEAGGDPPPLVSVPQLQAIVSALPGINFLYRSTPQKNAARENGGVVLTPAGKMLGGSGSHNHMVWERGSPHDYDRWAQVSQDESWEYKNILKYFEKIENYTGVYQNTGQHSSSGLLAVTESSFAPGADLWLRAGQELGYQVNDPNGPQTIGFSLIQSNRLNGRRASTYTGYLKPILSSRRRNLKVFKYSYVTRVIFKEKQAIGVEFQKHGIPIVAYASKEIIICTGAFISPIILFKSGIGPADQVKAAKAERLIVTLPVGQNLLDHPRVDVGPFYVNDSSLSWNIPRNLTEKDVLNFIQNGKGPLSSSLVQANAHVIATKNESMKGSMPSSIGDLPWPNFWIAYNAMNWPEPNSVGAIAILGLTRSKGVLTINETAKSMDDDYLPLLDYQHYSNDSDMDDMIEAINFFLTVMERTKPFQEVGAKLVPYGPCKSKGFRSREYWKCFIRYKTTTGFHTTGTCRMGHENDPNAVVDSKLRVIGVKGLRVVDGSIMPYTSNANTNAPTTIIAEKGAHEILKTYN